MKKCRTEESVAQLAVIVALLRKVRPVFVKLDFIKMENFKFRLIM